jgi:broad specificity phosphatase PhoE
MWIYLIRHAETDGNKHRIVQTPNTPLSSNGSVQAEHLASAYSGKDISLIICSDYARTQATAAPLHKILKCKLELNPMLRERNFGDLRGQSYDDIADDFFAPAYRPPGGETHGAFVSRVRNAWQYVINTGATQEGDIMIMTHGLVVRCILQDILKITQEQLAQSEVKNTCVSKISCQYPHQTALVCDVSHLPVNVKTDAEDKTQGAV